MSYVNVTSIANLMVAGSSPVFRAKKITCGNSSIG